MVTFFGESARGANRLSDRLEESDGIFLFDNILNDNGGGDDDDARGGGDISEKIAAIKAAFSGDGDISEKIADIKAALGIDGNDDDDNTVEEVNIVTATDGGDAGDCDDGDGGGGAKGAQSANDMRVLGVAGGAQPANDIRILGVAGGVTPALPINNVFAGGTPTIAPINSVFGEALPAAAPITPAPGAISAAPPVISATGAADLAGLGINGKLQINHPDAQAIADAFTKLAQNSPTFLQALKYAVETQNAGVLIVENEGLSEGALGSAEIDGGSIRLGDVAGGQTATNGTALPNTGELYSTITHELGHIIQNQHPNIYGAKYNAPIAGNGNAAQGNEHFSGADGNTGIDFNAEAYMADINREISAKGVTPLALSPEGT